MRLVGHTSTLGIITTVGPSALCQAQAKVLGTLLRKHYPDTPNVVIGPSAYVKGLESCWDCLVSEDPELKRGFESKLALWRYTPFDATLFLDSDIVPLRTGYPLREVIKELMESPAPVSFYGERRTEGVFQKLRVQDLKPHGIAGLWTTKAGGHYFWRRSEEAHAVFQQASLLAHRPWPALRLFARDGKWRVPDEVCVSIALEQLYDDLQIPQGSVFVGGKYYRGEGAFVHFFNDTRPLRYLRIALQHGAGRQTAGAVHALTSRRLRSYRNRA